MSAEILDQARFEATVSTLANAHLQRYGSVILDALPEELHSTLLEVVTGATQVGVDFALDMAWLTDDPVPEAAADEQEEFIEPEETEEGDEDGDSLEAES